MEKNDTAQDSPSAGANRFSLTVTLPDRQLKAMVPQPVTVSLEAITPESRQANFSVTVPKHIFELVKEHGIEYRPSSRGPGEIASLGFGARTGEPAQVLKNPSLAALIGDLERLGRDAVNIRALLELAQGTGRCEKFLAIRFSAENHARVSRYLHASMGTSHETCFQWFVLYRAEAGDDFTGRRQAFYSGELGRDGRLRPHALSQPLPAAGAGNDPNQGWSGHGVPDFAGFKLIPWTAEREAFFAEVETHFATLATRLNDFLADLDATKIDALLASGTKLIGAN